MSLLPCPRKDPEMSYDSRADLMLHPAFKDLEEDTDGRPCVWLNLYEKDGTHWSSAWSCQCDDEGVEPYDSEWIGPQDPQLIALWESLPEDEPMDAAQRHQQEQEALTGSEDPRLWITPTTPFIAFQPRELATILAALRFWQRFGVPMHSAEWDIATDGGTLKPLMNPEVDALIERMQT